MKTLPVFGRTMLVRVALALPLVLLTALPFAIGVNSLAVAPPFSLPFFGVSLFFAAKMVGTMLNVPLIPHFR